MPTLPFVSGTFFDQPVDGVPGVGGVVDGGRIQRPAQGAVHHVVALRAVLAADVLKDPDVAREGDDVVGRRDHRLQSGARRAGGGLVGVVGRAGEEDRHLAGAVGCFGTRITVWSFTPSRIAISTSRRWWSKLSSATLNSAGMSPPGGTANSCGVADSEGAPARAPAADRRKRTAASQSLGRRFRMVFADRVSNCDSAQAPSPEKLVWHPRRGGRMRAEAGSFRAQETGVHIPLPTPWPPFFPRRPLTGCGIGTRDSEHETIPVRSQRGGHAPSPRGAGGARRLSPLRGRSLALAAKWRGRRVSGAPSQCGEREARASFRAQETGVHIPLPTPWPPFFPRRSLTGCGIGTRDSEHETIPPQRVELGREGTRPPDSRRSRWPLASGFDGSRSRRSSCPSTSAGSSSWPP